MSDEQAQDRLRDELRSVLPNPAPASADATRRAREALSALIAEDEKPHPVVTPLARRRSPYRRLTAALLVAAAVIGVAAVGQRVLTDPEPVRTAAVRLTADQTPAEALHTAGILLASAPAKGTGDVRHLRFRNYSDPGTPVYDLYVYPDGTSSLDDEPRGEVAAYLTRDQLESLPTDPTALKAAMLELAKTQWTLPDEDPARGLLRLGVDLLTDPATPAATKKAVYGVLAGIQSETIGVNNLGRTDDLEGRPGIGLRFTFPEGAVETLVLDARTGALLSSSTTQDGLAFSGQAYLLSELVEEPPVATPA